MLPRPVSYCESHKQNPEMVTEMDRLLDHYNYAEVARILNEANFKTGDGLPLTSVAVGYVRKAYGLRSRFDRLRQRGLLTIGELAQACGVSTKTIAEWRHKGLLRGHPINDSGCARSERSFRAAEDRRWLLSPPRPAPRRTTALVGETLHRLRPAQP
jgi:hypothetical protein